MADHSLRGRRNLATGANTDDWHYSGVDIERDIAVDEWLDLREVSAAEPCVNCGRPLEVVRCIETGHIFKLGRRYAEAMGATVLDADGVERTITMGSYGIWHRPGHGRGGRGAPRRPGHHLADGGSAV